MQQQNPEALRAWFSGVQPLYAELFNAAHLMCGNDELAEHALRSAILDVWLQGIPGDSGFRDHLRASVRREAFEAAMSDDGLAAEITWQGVSAGRDSDPVTAQLAQESADTQRVALLRHGCGLSTRSISQLTCLSQAQVRAELRRFEARCRRRLPERKRARADTVIARQSRRLLTQPGPDIPPISQTWRAFQAEVADIPTSNRRASRVATALLTGLLALLCTVGFWLFAVLVQPY